MTDPGNCSVKAREGMRSEEYAALERLLRDVRPKTTLEIGMATGGSSIEICKTLRDVGGETHVAIDPYQSDPDGWNNQGINNVKAAGFDGLLEPIADFDYLALPKLVEQGRRFDFVLIDGWHSFDYTLVDLFYADLLLNVDGVVACGAPRVSVPGDAQTLRSGFAAAERYRQAAAGPAGSARRADTAWACDDATGA